MSENILEIRHLGKSFGTHEVLRDIDFTVKKGDVISIIGASGDVYKRQGMSSSRSPLTV